MSVSHEDNIFLTLSLQLKVHSFSRHYYKNHCKEPVIYTAKNSIEQTPFYLWYVAVTLLYRGEFYLIIFPWTNGNLY
jgi:hypothetical protein